MNITKIEISKTKRYGASKDLSLVIPKVFTVDNKIQLGDEIEFFRTEINGSDALVIVPQKSIGNNTPELSSKSQES